MNNLAIAYWQQGRWNEGNKLCLQVMDVTRRVLGEEHPHTLTIMDNLAKTYHKQGRWKEAEELALQVLEKRNKVLGDTHPDTLATATWVARRFGSPSSSQESQAAMSRAQPLRALRWLHPSRVVRRR